MQHTERRNMSIYFEKRILNKIFNCEQIHKFIDNFVK